MEGLKVERVRSFICDPAAMGAQQDIADVAGGDAKEKVFIRPANDKCHFHLFYKNASGQETPITRRSGGYILAQAIALDDGTRVICASDTIHTGAPDGQPNERLSQQVPIRCWAGTGRRFVSGDPVVPGHPEYAAWIKGLEPHPTKPETYLVTWIRDFSFQFLNMSDAGRPPTDGTYGTTFSVKNKKLVIGNTTKLADTTMQGSGTVTVTTGELSEEEIAALLNLSTEPEPATAAAPAPEEKVSAEPVAMAGTPVAGTLKGAPFKMDSARLKSSILEIRQGEEFIADASVKIFLFGKGKKPDGQRITVDESTRPGSDSPHLHVGRKPPGKKTPMTDILMSGYEMTLQFGQRSGNKLPGTIELSLPERYQTTIKGDFVAELK